MATAKEKCFKEAWDKYKCTSLGDSAPMVNGIAITAAGNTR
jgi:hypothetical protein